MTESEAIKMLNTFPKEDEMYDTAQIAIKALEKQIPKKPHKNFAKITEIAHSVAGDLEFVAIDFKKKDGFLKTNKLSRELGIYRQNYCGCEFSNPNKRNT